jgi:hypothetical protein
MFLYVFCKANLQDFKVFSKCFLQDFPQSFLEKLEESLAENISARLLLMFSARLNGKTSLNVFCKTHLHGFLRNFLMLSARLIRKSFSHYFLQDFSLCNLQGSSARLFSTFSAWLMCETFKSVNVLSKNFSIVLYARLFLLLFAKLSCLSWYGFQDR